MRDNYTRNFAKRLRKLIELKVTSRLAAALGNFLY